jgi:hypothetical protein
VVWCGVVGYASGLRALHPRTNYEGPEEEWKYSFPLSLTSTLVGGQRHAPAALPPGNTRYLFYRRFGGPQGRFGRVQKISSPHRDSNPRPSSPELVAIPTELPWSSSEIVKYKLQLWDYCNNFRSDFGTSNSSVNKINVLFIYVFVYCYRLTVGFVTGNKFLQIICKIYCFKICSLNVGRYKYHKTPINKRKKTLRVFILHRVVKQVSLWTRRCKQLLRNRKET